MPKPELLPECIVEFPTAYAVKSTHNDAIYLVSASSSIDKQHNKYIYSFVEWKQVGLKELPPNKRGISTDCKGVESLLHFGMPKTIILTLLSRFSSAITTKFSFIQWIFIFSLLLRTACTESNVIVQQQGTNNGEVCNKSLHLLPFATGNLLLRSFHDKSESNSNCVIKIYVRDPSFHIRLTFDYVAEKSATKDFGFATTTNSFFSSNCDKNYLHLGNNMNAVDVESLTSYKACLGSQIKEFVSRGPALWLAFSASSTKTSLSFSYEILPEVHCQNKTVFACSDVQCIPRDQVCDGHMHCTNGLDEYCGLTPGETCFQCLDGTCIKPSLPAYSTERGKKWWWLCDQYSHCLDDSDEIQGICFGLASRSNELFECHPAGHNTNTNMTILLLSTQLCDGLVHCSSAADEDHPKCHALIEKAKIRSEAIYVPLIAITLFSITMFVIGKHCEKKAASHDRFHVVQDGVSSNRQMSRRATKAVQDDETFSLHPITEV